MAPYDNETFHDAMMQLRNRWHLDRYKRPKPGPAPRDKQGFRKRHPRLIVAVVLATGAVLTALGAAIFRKHDKS